jgi:N-acetylmuramoyl-L-alanine amidase
MNKTNIVVIIDAGHGVDTPGKCSPDKKLLEYSWCRETAKLLSEKLTELGITNHILVPEVKDIPLKVRVQRANDMYAQLKKTGKTCCLISIHNNAAGNGKWMSARGWTCWVSNNASENSKKLAQLLYSEAEKLGLQGNRSIPKEKYWSSNFYILKNTKMPAVLTENMFQDNLDDVAYLLSDKGKQELVQLHVNGIQKYIEQL